MKVLITTLSSALLMAAFLYPLFFVGIGRPVSWLLVIAMAAGGIGGMYLLVRYRKSF